MTTRYGYRVVLFLVGVGVLVALLGAALWTSEALRRVSLVEAERDRWQRPTEVVQALGLGYHELTQPGPMLDRLFEAMRSGGRLVVVDPGPGSHPEPADHHHETAVSAELRLRRAGFEIERRKDPFIERAGDERWWLIVARKPALALRESVLLGPSRPTG
jgi:hypothetical protein